MKAQLCKCTNCENIMYDENPQIGAKKIETQSFIEVLPMELLNEFGDSFYGCGNCQTDEFLIDLLSTRE